MSSNKQRREAERVRLQRQLEERRQREAARRRTTTILSVVGALVLVAAIVVIVVVANSGSDDNKKVADPSTSPATTSATSPTAPETSAAPVPLPTTPCAAPPKGDTATFAGLTISGAKNLKAAPTVTGKEPATAPTALQCQDLVVGSGQAAKTSDQGTVEYVGLIYKTGKVFQSSWTSSPATFGLNAATPSNPNGVIAGFSQGIAGAGKVAPMKVGGRRVIIMPAVIAYGANPPPQSGIPADADLVFVVDLQKIAS